MAPRPRPTIERLEAKTIRDESGCWVFIGSRTPFGYGQIWDGEKVQLAHRASYRIHHGPIPESCQVLHHCDNPPCWNPAHLYAGTQKDNVHDCIDRGRFIPSPGRPRRQICRNGGHPIEEMIVAGKVRRYCRVCQRARERKHRAIRTSR